MRIGSPPPGPAGRRSASSHRRTSREPLVGSLATRGNRLLSIPGHRLCHSDADLSRPGSGSDSSQRKDRIVKHMTNSGWRPLLLGSVPAGGDRTRCGICRRGRGRVRRLRATVRERCSGSPRRRSARATTAPCRAGRSVAVARGPGRGRPGRRGVAAAPTGPGARPLFSASSSWSSPTEGVTDAGSSSSGAWLRPRSAAQPTTCSATGSPNRSRSSLSHSRTPSWPASPAARPAATRPPRRGWRRRAPPAPRRRTRRGPQPLLLPAQDQPSAVLGGDHAGYSRPAPSRGGSA